MICLHSRKAAMNSLESTISLVPKPDRREDLLTLMTREWSDSPELRLTLADIGQRWQLDSSTCSDLVDVLLDLRVIVRAADGTFRAVA
jgi:hypothetical protein